MIRYYGEMMGEVLPTPVNGTCQEREAEALTEREIKALCKSNVTGNEIVYQNSIQCYPHVGKSMNLYCQTST